MNKKITLFSALSAASIAVCVMFFILYGNFAFGGLDIALNPLQNAAFPIFGVTAAAAVTMRFIAPCIFKSGSEKTERSSLLRFADIAAWIFLALSLSALVASPLAETSAYIGLAALCLSLAFSFSLFSAVPLMDEYAKKSSNPVIIAAVGFILSVIPVTGLGFAVLGTVFSVAALREEKVSRKTGEILMALGIISMLIAVISTFCFVSLLF